MSQDIKAEAREMGAVELIRGYYMEALVKRVRESQEAHDRLLEATEALAVFNRTDRLPDARDALLVAVWSGSRVLRADADELRAGITSRTGGDYRGGDRNRVERMNLLRWLSDNGYDIGEVFAAELEEEGR